MTRHIIAAILLAAAFGAVKQAAADFHGYFYGMDCRELVAEREPGNWRHITATEDSAPTKKADSWFGANGVFASFGKTTIVALAYSNVQHLAETAWLAAWQRQGCGGPL